MASRSRWINKLQWGASRDSCILLPGHGVGSGASRGLRSGTCAIGRHHAASGWSGLGWAPLMGRMSPAPSRDGRTHRSVNARGPRSRSARRTTRTLGGSHATLESAPLRMHTGERGGRLGMSLAGAGRTERCPAGCRAGSRCSLVPGAVLCSLVHRGEVCGAGRSASRSRARGVSRDVPRSTYRPRARMILPVWRRWRRPGSGWALPENPPEVVCLVPLFPLSP